MGLAGQQIVLRLCNFWAKDPDPHHLFLGRGGDPDPEYVKQAGSGSTYNECGSKTLNR
jgi:hypothetical protein